MSLEFELLKHTGSTTNGMGQPIDKWEKSAYFSGYMDMQSGSDVNQTNTLIAESTQVVITWDMDVPFKSKDRIKNPRTNETFEINYVDNVMELNDHFEIYVKRLV